MTRREQILKLCAKEIDLDSDEVNLRFSAPFTGMNEMYALQKGLEVGIDTQKIRLIPIISLILEENEKLRGALENTACTCGSYPIAKKGGIPIIYNTCYRCQALTSSPLDELLEGEK